MAKNFISKNDKSAKLLIGIFSFVVFIYVLYSECLQIISELKLYMASSQAF